MLVTRNDLFEYFEVIITVGAWSNLLLSTSGFIGLDNAPTKIMTKQYSMNDSLKNHLAGVKK